MKPRASQGHSRASGDQPGNGDTILASFPRDGQDGKPAALRIYLSEFGGRKLLHIRQWWQARDRSWLPTKAGSTIRLGEIDATIAALTKARALLLADVAERSGVHDDYRDAGGEPSPAPVKRTPKPGSGLRHVAPWEPIPPEA